MELNQPVVRGHEMVLGQTPGHSGPYGHPLGRRPPPSAGPYVQTAYSYFDPNYQQRRKPVRAVQALHLQRGAPQKTEKQMLAITDKLETMSGNIEMLIQHQKTQSEQFHRQSEQFQRQSEQFQRQSEQFQRQSEQIRMLLTALQKNAGSGEFARRLQKPTQVDSTVEKYPFHRGASLEAQSKPGARIQTTSSLLKGGNQRGNQEGRRMDKETSSSPHGVWGTGQLHAPLTSNHSQTARGHSRGVSLHDGLMLDSEAVDRCFGSYMANIHNQHLFLKPVDWRNIIHDFKQKYSWDYRATQTMAATIGVKRKRETTDSPISMEEQNTPGFVGNRTQARAYSAGVSSIEHSVANAIVLLVIAFGKVTSHREPLPGPAFTPHSALYTDLTMPMLTPTSPFNDLVNLSGTNDVAVSSPANPHGKNMYAFPELAYFAKAADILGELPGSTDESHIYAHFLAGLYMAPLHRIQNHVAFGPES
ncbi:hypothetical protein LTR98_011482 [Exophiala xenobiotica]|nr:hypothetical protein LTR98_011482 [Exophiala xenobiotica]